MVPRKPAPDGKRIPLSVKVSDAKAAEIDAARGDTTRAVWLAAAIDVYLAERIASEILAEPGALVGIAVAGAEIAAGDVVSGVEAVRALRPRRKPETPGRAAGGQASPVGKAASADRPSTARGASGRQPAGDCPHTRAKRMGLLRCPDCTAFLGP